MKIQYNSNSNVVIVQHIQNRGSIPTCRLGEGYRARGLEVGEVPSTVCIASFGPFVAIVGAVTVIVPCIRLQIF